jgi:SulP family sulfate permease
MTVVLIPLAAKYGPNGVLLAGLVAGVLLLLAGLFKLGRHIHKLPTSIIEGFSAGIAIVIALQQVGWALGVQGAKGERVYETAFASLLAWLKSPEWAPLAMALTVMLTVILALKKLPKLPASMLVLITATAISQLFKLEVQAIPTITNPIGSLDIRFLGLEIGLVELLTAALGIAALGAFEALLSAKIADRMAGSKATHDSDRELIGQGLANVAVPFFGGVPATAALARTAVNVKSGGTSRVSAVAHSVFLLVMVLTLMPLVNLIPLSALAGVLLATAFNMVKFHELKATAKATPLDFVLVILSLVITVFVDLVSALAIATALWLLLRKTKLASAEKV